MKIYPNNYKSMYNKYGLNKEDPESTLIQDTIKELFNNLALDGYNPHEIFVEIISAAEFHRIFAINDQAIETQIKEKTTEEPDIINCKYHEEN